MYEGGCYESAKSSCWQIQSDCRSLKVRFKKFIVEEHLSDEDQKDSTCQYDKVTVSYNDKQHEFCDHTFDKIFENRPISVVWFHIDKYHCHRPDCSKIL